MTDTHFKFSIDEILKFGGVKLSYEMIAAYVYSKNIVSDDFSYENVPDEWKYEIYKKTYWDKFNGDEIDKSISIFLLDYSIQSGVVQALKSLQRALRDLGLYCGKIDGIFSFQTSEAMSKCQDFEELLKRFKTYRLKFIYTLSDYKKYKDAWKKRIDIVFKIAHNLFTWENTEELPNEIEETIEADMGVPASPENISKSRNGLVGFLAGLGLTITSFKEFFDTAEPFLRQIIDLNLGIPVNIIIGVFFLVISIFIWWQNKDNGVEV